MERKIILHPPFRFANNFSAHACKVIIALAIDDDRDGNLHSAVVSHHGGTGFSAGNKDAGHPIGGAESGGASEST